MLAHPGWVAEGQTWRAQILVCAVVDLTGLNFPSHDEFSEELYVSSATRRRYHGWC